MGRNLTVIHGHKDFKGRVHYNDIDPVKLEVVSNDEDASLFYILEGVELQAAIARGGIVLTDKQNELMPAPAFNFIISILDELADDLDIRHTEHDDLEPMPIEDLLEATERSYR